MATDSKVSIEDVQRTARLARLSLSEEQIQHLQSDLARIIEYVGLLQELDVRNVEPMTHPNAAADSNNRLAGDDPLMPINIKEIRANLPSTEGAFASLPGMMTSDEAGGEDLS